MAADGALTAAEVRAFLERFEQAQAAKSFDAVEGMLHPEAVFRFNDGDHRGLARIRAVFERTWNLGVTDERYAMSDIEVVHLGGDTAVATFTYRWSGVGEKGPFAIEGRGTTLLVRDRGRLCIRLEHLSR